MSDLVKASKVKAKGFTFKDLEAVDRGFWIPMHYEGKQLHMRTGIVRTPFGMQRYKDSLSPSAFSISVSIDADNPKALSLGTALKETMDAFKEAINKQFNKQLTEALADHYKDSAKKYKMTDLVFKESVSTPTDAYAPVARFTMPFFQQRHFGTDVCRRIPGKGSKQAHVDTVPINVSNYENIFPPKTVVNAIAKLSGGYFNFGDDDTPPNAGIVWQFKTVLICSSDQLPGGDEDNSVSYKNALLEDDGESTEEDADALKTPVPKKKKPVPSSPPPAPKKRLLPAPTYPTKKAKKSNGAKHFIDDEAEETD